MLSSQNVQRVVAWYLAHCFLAGRSPQIADLARYLSIPPPVLSAMFLRATHRKLGAFLRLQQVLQARRLLRYSAAGLRRVARGSGYETERSFFRAFRRSTGTTPARFRQLAALERGRDCRCCLRW